MQLLALPRRWFGAFAAAPLLVTSLLLGGTHLARAAADISKPGTPIAPSGYGEYNLENWVGPGGTSMSAIDAVRLATALADPDGGGIFTKSMRQAFLTDCLSGGRYAFDSTRLAKDGSFYGDKGGSLSISGNVLYFETAGVSFSINGAAGTAYGPSFYPSNAVLLKAIRTRTWKDSDLWEANGYKPVASKVQIKYPLPQLSLPTGQPIHLHLAEPVIPPALRKP